MAHAVQSQGMVRWLTVLVLLLVVALLGAVVWKAWPLLFPQAQQVAQVVPGCDLHHGPCVARFDTGGSVTLSITPRPVAMLAPLALEVRLDGLAAERVELDFQGREMFMGYNRRQLMTQEPGLYRGEGVLPMCVTDWMTWEATVLIETDEGLLAAPFAFVTERPRP